MRGLKYEIAPFDPAKPSVAPYTGAWIEISRSSVDRGGRRVAPYTGAWIEIKPFDVTVGDICRTLHGCVD